MTTNMKIIQLQRLDKDTRVSLGGLYLNINHISSIYYDKPTSTCIIEMVLARNMPWLNAFLMFWMN